MTNGPTLATVVLTYNEERNIADCLATLQWVDELLVVDSASTDRTVELALRAGARVVHQHLQPFDFSVQRNYALLECALASRRGVRRAVSA